MKNRKNQLLSILLVGSVLAALWAVPVSASQGTKEAGEKQQVSVEDGTDGYQYKDDTFQGYITSLFYQNSGGLSCQALDSTGKSTLNSTEKKLYHDLKPLIQEVAAGKRTSTIFDIDVSKYGSVFQFTAGGGKKLTKTSVTEKLKDVVDSTKVWYALLADMPYELYWHDKAQSGCSMSYSYLLEGGGKSASITEIHFRMGVNAKYAQITEKGKSYNPMQMSSDTAKTVQRAKKAAAYAKQIVEDNKNKSDLEKLKAYMSKICELNTYNKTAAGFGTNNTKDGIDPWQLVYVFDQNPATNVVCEGYAKAFEYLCDLSTFQNRNIACYAVGGITSGEDGAGGHMWNIVTMEDGNNYLADVTNCDSGTVGSPDKLFLVALPGSPEGIYTYKDPFSGSKLTYSYDDSSKMLYGTGKDSILTLKPVGSYTKYSPSSVTETGSEETETPATQTAAKDVVVTLKKDSKGTVASAKIKAGKTFKIKFAGAYYKENKKSISFSTTDKKVVKVSKNGTVKALKKGTASVKVRIVLKNGTVKNLKVKVIVN